MLNLTHFHASTTMRLYQLHTTLPYSQGVSQLVKASEVLREAVYCLCNRSHPREVLNKGHLRSGLD